MAASKNSKAEEMDTALDVVQAIDQLDLKTSSFVQLRRLYTAAMQVAADIDEELKLRSADDHEGDTVRVPVASPKN